MNLHITTTENGQIKRYSIDFQPHETAIALNTIHKLQGHKTETSTKITKKTKATGKPVNTKTSRIIEKFDISTNNINIAATYLKPNIKKALMGINIPPSSWNNARARNNISQKLWEKLANGFRIPYNIEDGTIIITPQQLPQFEEITDCVEKKTAENLKHEGQKGVFVRYKAGGNLIDKWMAEEDEKEVIKKLKAIYKRKNKSAAYPITFKIQEIKRISYEEYKNQYVDKI